MNPERFATTDDPCDPAAFVRFYRANLPSVYGYVHRLCAGDTALAEDLTQDTWMALAVELQRGNSSACDIRWLVTVARSRFLDHARRQRRWERRLTLLRGHSDRVDEPTEHDVLARLDAVEPLHRLVLVLRYVDDMTVPAIAETIGRTVTATNSLLARARAGLRNHKGEPANV
jgi:RNA polymerase sigma-70 factor, ECF subfamily